MMTYRDDSPICQTTAPDAKSGDSNGGASILQRNAIAAPDIDYTGERIVPGKIPENLFLEHEARYVFAGGFVNGMRVLDVACGSGIGTHYLLKAGAQSCLGFDIDRSAIDYASAVYGDCVFTQCEAVNLCLPDNSIDVVVSFETIEHVMDQLTFLRECKRVLRPGGRLICSTPNRTISRWGQKNPFHFRELTVVEFADLLTSMFSEVQLYAQKCRIYPVFVARKVLLSVLEKLRLTEPTKRFLRWKPTRTIPRTEFGDNPNDLNGITQLHHASSLIQPMFTIAVGRKPLH
jgi:2-polyprenyl-3-methyl-5-hydroxy-6-metoxy-1,4-benzoquinol methylase